MFIVLNDMGGEQMSVTDNVTATLRAESHNHLPIVLSLSGRRSCSYGFKYLASSQARGIGWEREVSPTISTCAHAAVLIAYEECND